MGGPPVEGKGEDEGGDVDGNPGTADLFQVRPGEILDGEIDDQATQPKKPIRELPGHLPCRWLVIDALVPDLQGGGHAHRPDEHDRGPTMLRVVTACLPEDMSSLMSWAAF